jgi:hypothetical protein
MALIQRMSLLTRQLNRQAGRLPRSARLGPDPCRAQPPQPLTHTRSLQVIGPRAAQFSTPFGEHAAYLIDPLEVAVAEAVPASRGPPVRARSRTGAVSCRSRLVRLPLVQPNAARSQYGPDRSLGTGRPGLSGRLLHEHARSGFNALGVACLRDSRSVIASGLEHSDVSVANENPGSLTGSQRPQISGYARPRPAILSATGPHVRPHSAPPGHASKVPPKQ